jgi:nucleotide-binding universal stress UspA family protein
VTRGSEACQGLPDIASGCGLLPHHPVLPILCLVPLLLVATDGRESSAGAIRLARRLAESHQSDVELLTVGDTRSGRSVEALLDTLFVSPPTWPHTIAPGEIGPALTRISRERNPYMLIVGMKTDSERRTAIRFASSAPIPVLVVPAHVAEQPRRALLALDFSQSSLHAATVALKVLAKPARAFMVSEGPTGMREDPEPHIGLLFDAVEAMLGIDRDLALSRHTIAGETAAALLQAAARQSVDLISVGRCGRSHTTCTKPATIGRVARAIVASATCGVLIAAAPNLLPS